MAGVISVMDLEGGGPRICHELMEVFNVIGGFN